MTSQKFKFIRTDDDWRPMLGITITNPQTGAKVNTYALLDTGASITTVPDGFMNILKLERCGLKPKKFITAGGETNGHIAICQISILCPKGESPVPPLETHLAHDEPKIFDVIDDVKIASLTTVREPLIGVADMLTRYIINIDYPKEEFSLTKP